MRKIQNLNPAHPVNPVQKNSVSSVRSVVFFFQHKPRSLTHLCEQVDARWGIPRPATAPHLPPLQAMSALLGLVGEGLLLLACGLFSALIWRQCTHWLLINIEVEIICHLCALLSLLMPLLEIAQLFSPVLSATTTLHLWLIALGRSALAG
ncbi:MAG: hypothetical protein U0Y68_14905 [Blastocatellia bacterium]